MKFRKVFVTDFILKTHISNNREQNLRPKQEKIFPDPLIILDKIKIGLGLCLKTCDIMSKELHP